MIASWSDSSAKHCATARWLLERVNFPMNIVAPRCANIVYGRYVIDTWSICACQADVAGSSLAETLDSSATFDERNGLTGERESPG